MELFLISLSLFPEAIRAILLYSQSTEELLKRKKVFRDTIFKYLASKGIIVPPSSEKHQLISHAKHYWCEQLQDRDAGLKHEKPDIKVRLIVCGPYTSGTFLWKTAGACSFF